VADDDVIRVGFLCDHLDLGGQELGCLEVVRRIDRTRFLPFVYAFRPGPLVDEFRALGVPLVVGHDRPGSARSNWSERDDEAVRSYRRQLARSLRADAIDVAIVYAWQDGVPAAQEAGVSAIVERIDGPHLHRRIRDKSSCNRIICQSRVARDVLVAQRQMLGCEPKRIAVVANGIDRRRFDPRRYDREQCRADLGLADDAFAIGTVGRLSAEKNQSHLLRATAHLVAGLRADEARRVRVFIAGPDGGARADLERETRELEIGGYVTFLGTRRDVPEILRALDVFALTSMIEGTPFSAIEAIAMGLPIVATQVGALHEMIDGNGYLVSVSHPEDTAAAFAELCRDAALRQRLARRSRLLARRYDIERMVRRYEALLVEALDEVRQQPRFRPV
jgi:glycosyltransferase involved in cell wall biosynthesis